MTRRMEKRAITTSAEFKELALRQVCPYLHALIYAVFMYGQSVGGKLEPVTVTDAIRTLVHAG